MQLLLPVLHAHVAFHATAVRPASLVGASPRIRMAVIEPSPPEGFEWATFTDEIFTEKEPAAAAAPAAIVPVEPSKLTVLEDADAVGAAICAKVEAAAAEAIAKRGHFALAIPGGSVLKMLAGSAPSWALRTIFFAVLFGLLLPDLDECPPESVEPQP